MIQNKPVESLTDEELLAVCDSQLDSETDDVLSGLLEQNREGPLSDTERRQLEELIQLYRVGLVRKSQALRIAVSRNLRPRLS